MCHKIKRWTMSLIAKFINIEKANNLALVFVLPPKINTQYLSILGLIKKAQNLIGLDLSGDTGYPVA